MKRDKILKAAIKIALMQSSFRAVTRDGAAEKAGVSPSLVNHHFGTVGGLHDEMVSYAIRNDVWLVIAQALIENHPLTKDIPGTERREIFAKAARPRR